MNNNNNNNNNNKNNPKPNQHNNTNVDDNYYYEPNDSLYGSVYNDYPKPEVDNNYKKADVNNYYPIRKRQVQTSLFDSQPNKPRRYPQHPKSFQNQNHPSSLDDVNHQVENLSSTIYEDYNVDYEEQLRQQQLAKEQAALEQKRLEELKIQEEILKSREEVIKVIQKEDPNNNLVKTDISKLTDNNDTKYTFEEINEPNQAEDILVPQEQTNPENIALNIAKQKQFPSFLKKELHYNIANATISGIFLLIGLAFLAVCIIGQLKPHLFSWYNWGYFVLDIPEIIATTILFGVFLNKVLRIKRYLKSDNFNMDQVNSVIVNIAKDFYCRIINLNWFFISFFVISLLFILFTFVAAYIINANDSAVVDKTFGNLFIGPSTHPFHYFPYYSVIIIGTLDSALLIIYITLLAYNIYNKNNLDAAFSTQVLTITDKEQLKKSINRRNLIILLILTVVLFIIFIIVYVIIKKVLKK